MNPIIKYYSLLILLTLVLGCKSVNSEEKSEKSPKELIIGTWQCEMSTMELLIVLTSKT